MKQQALIHFQQIHLTLVAMILFGCVFIGMILRTLSKDRRVHYEKLAQLPLQEEQSELKA